MPFLFWWNTWFGRQLSDKQLNEYLQDDKKPRHIQHALVQIGERVTHHDSTVTRWYPDVVRLASYPIEEVRNTDAWVMGQDSTSKDASSAGFHQALLKMLNDPSLMVRGNAALSLVRFGDATGRPQIVALLQPAKVVAPQAGKITDSSAAGTVIHQGGIIAKIKTEIESGSQATEVRSPITAGCESCQCSPDRPLPLATRLQRLIQEPSRCGKRYAPSTWSGSQKTLQRSVHTSASWRRFPITYESRRSRPSRRSGNGVPSPRRSSLRLVFWTLPARRSKLRLYAMVCDEDKKGAATG